MKVLTLNCGSSTLKGKLFETSAEGSSHDQRPLATVRVERIGRAGSLQAEAEDTEPVHRDITAPDHAAALGAALAALNELLPGWRDGLVATGHRVVHGGERFREPVLLDDTSIEALEALGEIAPLHNGPALAAIRQTRALLGATLPAVAVFDTAFHRTMPARAARYAIPFELTETHGLYRFGFHGLAHRSMAEQYAAMAGSGATRRLITLQLGNGCSVAAIEGGRCIDTSMGFTPLEGLVMGTRSGDIDPAAANYLARREGVTAGEVEDWLNTRSGLLGVSGRSADVRDLLAAEAEGDKRAALALEMFCYRARKYAGAYMAALGGADAVIFGGGIGENSPAIRARICAGLEWAGLSLDPGRNQAPRASAGEITASGSRIKAYVFEVDEESLIARDTLALVQPG